MIDPITGYVRVKAICLFVNGDLLLAIDGFDPTKRQRFWVPVGGRVEFGELSRDAIVREVEEELSAEITELELLGVLENVFSFDGSPGHEIVFVYDGRFVERSFYEGNEVTGIEGDEEFTAHWIDPSAPKNGWPLYPEGLLELLEKERHRSAR
jgi:8-oxo-dGTP pyrophosphatase MutT (NUDIX family)